MSREACAATHIEQTQSHELLHLRMACLSRRLSQVRALGADPMPGDLPE